MKFGKVTKVKKTVSFTLLTLTVLTVASNQDTDKVRAADNNPSSVLAMLTVNESTVSHCLSLSVTVCTDDRQLEPLPSKDLSPIVSNVSQNSAPSEKSKNLLLSSPPSQPLQSAAIPKSHKTFKIGDRVVVKDVGGIYQGARGEVVDNIYSRAGSSYLVRFDKPIKNIQQFEFEASDLMKL
jgi:hypothetical protein